MLSPTRIAIEKFDNSHQFERMSGAILMGLGYKHVVLIAPRGGSDDGKDITYENKQGQKGLGIVSLRVDAFKKVMSDLKQRVKGEYSEYTYITSQYLTAKEKVKIARYCAEKLEAEFRPMDRETLALYLDTPLQSVRQQYLHIKPEPVYTLRLGDVQTYDANKIAQEAANWAKDVEAAEVSKQRYAGVMPDFIGLGLTRYSPTEKIARAKEYATNMREFAQKAARTIDFNFDISSNHADQNVEIKITAQSGVQLDLDDKPLTPPIRPELDHKLSSTFSVIPRTTYHRSKNEFYAIRTKNGDKIQSNIDAINAGSKKIVLDERGRAILPAGHTQLELNIEVYSSSISQPVLQEINVTLTDIVPTIISEDGEREE